MSLHVVDDYIMSNLIYCEDAHSFVHRLYAKWAERIPDNYRDAQQEAWQVVAEMQKERAK
jgi:hypothetical protein